MWERFKRVIKPRGAIVLTASQPFTSALVMSNPTMFRYEWMWDKKLATGGATSQFRPMKAHENICVFSLGSEYYYPQMITRSEKEKKRDARADYERSVYQIYGTRTMTVKSRYGNTEKHPVTVIRINALNRTEHERSGHPTQKPVALFRYLIRTYTQPGDVVLDPCVGSGTTALAAREEQRHWICGDSSAEYVEVARKRMDAPYTLPLFQAGIP
jgi:site-specific DNA-methyltransferase (adenine-specific)